MWAFELRGVLRVDLRLGICEVLVCLFTMFIAGGGVSESAESGGFFFWQRAERSRGSKLGQ